jgi:hypothetical protein
MYSCECLQVRAWHSILRVIEVFNVHMTIGLSLVVAGVSWYLSSRVPSGFFKRRKGDNQLGPLWRFFSFGDVVEPGPASEEDAEKVPQLYNRCRSMS